MDLLSDGSTLLRIETAAFIPVAVICGIGIVIVSLFIAVNVKYRNYKILKMTSPNLNLVMLAGAIVLFIAIILFGANSWLSISPTQEMLSTVWRINHAGTWLASVGFTLFFSPLAAKTWRVHRIFTDAAVKGRVIKDDKLLCFVAVLVALDLGFLGLWFGLDQPMCFVSPKEYLPGFLLFSQTSYEPQTTSTPTSTFTSMTSLMTKEFVSVCASKYTPMWVIFLVVYKAVLLFYVIYVAWSTRYVTLPSMKDAGGLIISIFVTMMSFCVCTPFVMSLHRWPSAQYVVTSCAFFIPIYTVLFLHFVPKVILIRRHSKDEILTRSFSQYATPRKPEFSEDEIRDLAIQNASLRKEVSEKQRRYKTVLEQLRVAKAKLIEYSIMTSEHDDVEHRAPTTDETISRSMETESSPMTSTGSDSLKMVNDITEGKKKKLFFSGKKIKESTPCKKEEHVDTVTPDITSSSDIIVPTDANAIVGTDVIVSLRNANDEKSAVTSSNYRKQALMKTIDTTPRHVSFTNNLPSRKENGDKTKISVNPGYRPQPIIQPHPSLLQIPPKQMLPPLGKHSWDYYTRGTGYLKYKATVLNHGVNGTIAAITGYPVSPPEIIGMTVTQNPVRSVYCSPMSKVPATKTDKARKNEKKTEFRYYSTSAGSRTPSVSTDMTSSVAGQPYDSTMSSNSTSHSGEHSNNNKHSSNDTDVPSANSAFSVVKKEKRPFSGNNDVIVTSHSKVTSHGASKNSSEPDYAYEEYSSDSDSDDYDETSTSMDSITCELFPPLTPRHKHYLRRYDAIHAKYLEQRERLRRKHRKMQHSEKSEGYSSGNDDVTRTDVIVRGNDVITALTDKPASSKKLLANKKGKLIARTDDSFLYDSITSSDSDSSDWGDTDTLQRCWEKAAQMRRLPLLQAGPITYSHTRGRDGIFV